MCNILLQSVQIWQTWMKFQESSPVLSTPDIILLTKLQLGNQGKRGKTHLIYYWRHRFFLVVQWSMVRMVRLERQQERFLKIYFEFAYYGFISYSFGTNRQLCSYTTAAPSKIMPDSRPKSAKSITVFRPKRPKNHTNLFLQQDNLHLEYFEKVTRWFPVLP